MHALQIPPDGGSLYTETNLQNIFPEPLNALTSCFFLAIAMYWTFKLWRNFRTYPFLSYCLLLLYIGGIGGTTYHAFRQWRPFIMMDWLPIMLLCVSAGVYFLAQLIKWYYALLLVVAYAACQFLLRSIDAAQYPIVYQYQLCHDGRTGLATCIRLSHLYQMERWKVGRICLDGFCCCAYFSYCRQMGMVRFWDTLLMAYFRCSCLFLYVQLHLFNWG